MTAADLRRILIPRQVPESEQYARYWGRGLGLDSIQTAIRQAVGGVMVELTDLIDEILELDPHASGTLGKRLGSLETLDWELAAAKGKDIDEGLAEEMADETRQAVRAIPFFAERIYDLAWALCYGRAGLETLWDIVAGPTKWMPRELLWIHPRRLAFGPERELRLINTLMPPSQFIKRGVPLRDYPGKFITWTPRMFSRYQEKEGLGIRLLYWCFHKRFDWRMRLRLVELFALGWRSLEPDKDVSDSWDANDAVFAQLEKLHSGGNIKLPPGVKLVVTFPDGTSGDLLQMTGEDIDKQISKLVLGNTGTTEGNDANRANSIIQKGEQDILLVRDAAGLSGRIQEHLIVPFVVLNRGAHLLDHAPKFRLRADPPRDVAKELDNATKVLNMGLPVSEQQIRELTGLRRPDPGESYIVMGGSGGTDALGNPLPRQMTIVDPKAETDPDTVGELEEGGVDQAAANAIKDVLGDEESGGGGALASHEAPGVPGSDVGASALAPTTIGSALTVNEIRSIVGFGPKLLPNGAPDPTGDMTAEEAKAAAKHTAPSDGHDDEDEDELG